MKNSKLKANRDNMRRYCNERADIGRNVCKRVCAYNISHRFSGMLDFTQKICLIIVLRYISTCDKKVLEIEYKDLDTYKSTKSHLLLVIKILKITNIRIFKLLWAEAITATQKSSWIFFLLLDAVLFFKKMWYAKVELCGNLWLSA